MACSGQGPCLLAQAFSISEVWRLSGLCVIFQHARVFSVLSVWVFPFLCPCVCRRWPAEGTPLGPSQPRRASSREGVRRGWFRACTVSRGDRFLCPGWHEMPMLPTEQGLAHRSQCWRLRRAGDGVPCRPAPLQRARPAQEGAEGASCRRCVLGTAVTTGPAGAGEGGEHSRFEVGAPRGLVQASDPCAQDSWGPKGAGPVRRVRVSWGSCGGHGQTSPGRPCLRVLCAGGLPAACPW